MTHSHKSPDSLFRNARKALKANDFAMAEASFIAGLEQDPLNLSVWLELSRAYVDQRNLNGAAMAVEAAMAAAPHSPEPHLQMAQIYNVAGNVEKMFAAWESAYKLAPTPTLAQTIALAYMNQKLPRRSLPFLRDLVQSDPLNKTHQYRLAAMLHDAGNTPEAVKMVLALVQAEPENVSYCALYAAVMKGISLQDDATLAAHKKALAHVLTHPEITPQTIAFPAYSILRHAPEYEILQRPPADYTLADIQILAGDAYLLACIARLKTMHGGLEGWITALRRSALLHWRNDPVMMSAAAELLAAVAIACWFSDYAFDVTAAEAEALSTLSDADVASLALFAAYEPLTTDPTIDGGPYWRDLIRLQVIDAQVERAMHDSFTPLKPITDTTSLSVQEMYEGRPYPRWQHVITFQAQGVMGQTGQGMNLLIGGCGTGQEILHFAANLVDIKITAIDLSRRSLAYAKRKAVEFGYAPRVAFYHGDLLDAGQLDVGFDVISSSGVLHHLKEPEEGLKALLSCLNPGGRLHLALYADYARTHYLSAAKALVAAGEVQSDACSLRAFRQRLLALPSDDPASRVTQVMDFYSLNECTDLLFHVQECWYTLPQLRDMLDRHGLELMTMKLQPVWKATYWAANPQDRMVRDWDTLIAFEKTSDAAAFIGMYDFWVKRKEDVSNHPLDAGILRQMI